MLKNKGFWYILMSGALAGWAFSIVGLVKPMKNETLKKIWKMIFCSWVFGHPLELALALGIGKAQGLSRTRTILKTLAFGFTWWLPLKLGVIKK
jgi:uncharacterized protein YhhL (DUF1145 family)